MEVRDLRNIREAELDLAPGLNVFVGRNAQGKTSLLEAVGLLARGRSFRTEETRTLIRRGAQGLRTQGTAVSDGRQTALEVELTTEARRLRVDGREVPPRSYHGRLDVVVYSTDRLRVVRGPMRERRLFLDRGAAALWPTYRDTLRDYERVVLQRNAALEHAGRGLEAWDEGFLDLGARLRSRRGDYVRRLRGALAQGLRPGRESYEIGVEAGHASGEEASRAALRREMETWRRDEQRARRSLVGPHRDAVRLLVDGEDAASASSGQARSLLIALTLAALDVHREERGSAAVALLDDLDSELDEERAGEVCREVTRRGQALVTTTHAAWARGLAQAACTFEVAEGRVKQA